jgi:hypothetical protein
VGAEADDEEEHMADLQVVELLEVYGHRYGPRPSPSLCALTAACANIILFCLLSASSLLHRVCNPGLLAAVDKRNELSVEKREAEYLVRAKFTVRGTEDEGFTTTSWVTLQDLAELDGDDVEEAMDAWREAEELFREGFRAVAEHEQAEAAPGE